MHVAKSVCGVFFSIRTGVEQFCAGNLAAQRRRRRLFIYNKYDLDTITFNVRCFCCAHINLFCVQSPTHLTTHTHTHTFISCECAALRRRDARNATLVDDCGCKRVCNWNIFKQIYT